MNDLDAASIVRLAVVQIGDESLLGASYTEADLQEQLEAAFARHGRKHFSDFPSGTRTWCLDAAKEALENQYGLVCPPSEDA